MPPDGKQAAAPAGVFLPQLVSNLAETLAAREGTSSALGYVTSGLGVAIHSVVGVDPINANPVSSPSIYSRL